MDYQPRDIVWLKMYPQISNKKSKGDIAENESDILRVKGCMKHWTKNVLCALFMLLGQVAKYKCFCYLEKWLQSEPFTL